MYLVVLVGRKYLSHHHCHSMLQGEAGGGQTERRGKWRRTNLAKLSKIHTICVVPHALLPILYRSMNFV